MTRRLAVAAVLLLVALPRSSSAEGTPTPIEARYAHLGPYKVASDTVSDAAGTPRYQLLFPADIGTDGQRHPIVTWGNGSFASPTQYERLLYHLASWGFVVVAANTDQAGTGVEILDGVRLLLAADQDPASRFFAALDTGHIAAIGHSQGAGGAVRATVASNGLITTVVTIALPHELFVLEPPKTYDVAGIPAPVLFLGARNDALISGAGTNLRFFDEVSVPAAVGVLTAADHNTIQASGGGFLGYITAWLQYRLRDDPDAARAFAGDAPELLTNPAWQAQRTKGLLLPLPIAMSGSGGPALPITGAASAAVPGLLLLAAALAAAHLHRKPATPGRQDRDHVSQV